MKPLLLRLPIRPRYYIFLFCLLSQIISSGQSIDPTTNYIPSPDAVGLGKYGDVSIGYHTGSASTGIPIYTLKGKKLSVPISLNYSSGGIRVDEVASSVGLGWSLLAGGSITRSVRGIPDEKSGGFPYAPDADEILDDAGYLHGVSSGTLDGEPDEFFYNFMGQSGKFIIDKGFVVRTIPHNNLKIVPASDLSEIIVNTPDGSIYTFASREESASYSSCTNSSGSQDLEYNTTAWYLTTYENPAITNEKIHFIYDTTTVTYLAGYSQEKYAPATELGLCNGSVSIFDLTAGSSCDQPVDGECIIYSSSRMLLLDSIYTEVSSIGVDHGSRSDLNNGLKYSEFRAYGSTNTLLQTITLDHSYFTSTGRSMNANFQYFSTPTEHHKRLKLDKVTVLGTQGETLEHTLEYYEESLPPRLSFAQDFWGYYNGKDGNNVFVPYVPNSLLQLGEVANRLPNPETASNGMLKKITYPTGGSATFEYEGHQYLKDAAQVIDDVTEYPNILITTDTLFDPQKNTFFLPLASGLKEDVVISYNWIFGGGSAQDIAISVITTGEDDQITIATDLIQITGSNGNGTITIPKIVEDEVGIKLIFRADNIDFTINRVDYYKTVLDTTNRDVAFIGGARISKITMDDLEDGNELIKTYKYVKSSGQSSGEINYYPTFDFMNIKELLCGNYVVRCTWPGRKSQTYSPLGEHNGSPIFYSRVEEHFNGGDLGYSAYTYNINLATPASFHGRLVAQRSDGRPNISPALAGKPLDNDNWNSGMLQHEVHYKKGGAKIMEKSYTYNFNAVPSKGNHTIKAIAVQLSTDFEVPGLTYSVIAKDHFNAVTYNQYANWYTTTSINEKFYDDGGGSYVEKNTTNTFYPSNLMPATSSFTNSDGATYLSNNIYHQVGDYDQSSGHYAILNEESTTSKNAQIISGSKQVYPTSDTLQLPEEVYNYEGSFGWDLYGTYGTYSSDGYPASFTKAHYPPVNYTWSDGLLTDQSFAGFTWEFDYDDNSRLQDYLKQVDGQEITYTYDGLQRLKQVIERSGARTTTHSYTLGGPNYLTTSISFADAPTQTVVKEHDGLGRYMRTRSVAYDPQTGNDVITDGGDLDPLGRTVKQVFLPDEYVTLTYEGAPSGRLQKTTYPDAASIKNKYPYSDNYFVNLVIDENEHGTKTISDIVEKTHHIINPAGDTTTYSYNGFDNVATIKTPKGQFYTYGYDTHQRQNSKTMPGGGTTTYVYNMRDLVATMTDPNTKVTTHAYDDHDRDTLTIIDGKEIKHTYLIDRLITRSAETFESQVLEETFTYDAYGRVSQRAADNILQTDGDIYDLTYFHTDLTKTSTRAHTGHEGVTINESFGYDNWMRLKKHQHGLQGGPSATIQGNAYNKRDELIGRSLGGVTGGALQSIDYKYHVRGWLTDINTVESGTDLLPLADCDSVPLGSPIPGLFPPGNTSDPEMLTLGEIINRRFNDEIAVGDYNACQEVACDTLECTAQERLDQLTSFTEILQTMDSLYITRKTVPCEGTSFIEIREGRTDSYIIPAELVRVRLCDGTEYYIPEHLLSSLSGTYEIVQELAVSSLDQTFEVSIGGNVGTYTLEQLLLLVAEGESIEVDGYMMCTITDCSTPTIPSCDSAATANQNAFIQMLEDSNYTIEPSTLSYPVTLNRVILCSGVELYLLDSELDSLPGNFAVLDEEEFADDEERKEVNPDEQNLLDAGDLFREKLYYDIASQTLDGDAQRNGNIAHLYWQVMGRTPKGYGFQYDVLDRVTKGTFGEVITGNGGLDQITQSDRYSVYGITYDEDGNLETLNRNGPIDDCGNAFDYGQIDGLTYSISGNHLTSMTDAGTRAGYFVGPSGTYNYDGAGNMIYVGPKNLTLSYNALNLPESGSYGAGASTSWDYAADGRKVKYEGIDDTKEYMEGIEYRNNDIFIYHPEGRVLKDSTGEWVYEYSLKDHLGNTRVVFADLDLDGTITDSTEVLHEAHYYPFGMEMEGPWNRQRDTLQPYLYNGKEFHFDSLDVDGDQVKELALGWYDYGARFYDPSVGRFTGVDPISDQFPHVSTYNYAENEPVAHIDLHGLQKVRFDSRAANNSTFMTSYQINRQTSGGAKFTSALKNQSKVDVLYTVHSRGDGLTAGPFASYEEFIDKRSKNYNLYYSTDESVAEIKSYFEEGKELLIISAGCTDGCTKDQVRETAQSLNHEEVAHGINRLTGNEKTQETEHQLYQNSRSLTSPNTGEIKNNPKYKDTPAKKQLDEIDKIISNGY